MTEKQRLYTVEEIETGSKRKYVTDLKNGLLYFPFSGNLWVLGNNGDKKYSEEQISPGEIIVANDSFDIFHEPKYPYPARVLSVFESRERETPDATFTEVFDENLDVRLYLLSKGKDLSRRVIAANSQNLIYNHLIRFNGPVPEALVKAGGKFSDEFFEPLTPKKVEIKPVFVTKSYDETFNILDTRVISYLELEASLERHEAELDRAALDRASTNDVYFDAIEQATSRREKLRLEKEMEQAHASSEVGTLEERMEEEFFGGEL